MSHPIGEKHDAFQTLNDISKYDVAGENSTQVSIKLPGGGEATNRLEEMDDYIDQNFVSKQISFPPFYMKCDSLYSTINKRFDEYLKRKERKRYIILTEVDLIQDLATLGYSTEQIREIFDNEFGTECKETLNSIVFDVDKRAVYVITLRKEEELLNEAHIRSDRNLKAFFIIAQNLIGQFPMAAVGVVASLTTYRQEASWYCSKCSLQTIAKNDMETTSSFDNWFNQLSSHVQYTFQSHLGFYQGNDEMTSSMMAIANRFMMLSSINDTNLPLTSVGSAEDKINRLLLTEEQLNAVYDPSSKRKVIKGILLIC